MRYVAYMGLMALLMAGCGQAAANVESVDAQVCQDAALLRDDILAGQVSPARFDERALETERAAERASPEIRASIMNALEMFATIAPAFRLDSTTSDERRESFRGFAGVMLSICRVDGYIP